MCNLEAHETVAIQIKEAKRNVITICKKILDFSAVREIGLHPPRHCSTKRMIHRASSKIMLIRKQIFRPSSSKFSYFQCQKKRKLSLIF